MGASGRRKVFERLAGLPAQIIGSPNPRDELRLVCSANPVFAASRVELERTWSEVSFRMQQLRDEPTCAREEFDRILDREDPGLSAVLTFDPAEDVAAPYVAKGARPRVAILREQGVNGHVEMAAAFDRAGFDAHDVHMSDVAAGRVSLADFKGVVAGGGFSYGDVLGAGAGWAKAILFNERARDQFSAFFARGDAFALGACNGCQMMSQLKELIPGAEHWPQFARNRSEQFEARFVMAEVTTSPSLFFSGMTGSRMAIATAHGEGRALFDSTEAKSKAIVALRFLLLHPRNQLLLDRVERGELQVADIVQLDDVPAELGLYRRFGVFPLFQLGERFGERLDESARRIPVEIAALFLRPRILGLLGEILELRAFLQLRDDFIGLRVLVDQDVPGLVFLVAARRFELVVLRQQVLVLGRMRFEVVLDDRLHEHLLAHQLELGAHVGALSKTSAIGFLGDHLLRDEVVEDRLSRLLAVGLTLRRALLDDELQAGLGNGLAVDRHRLGRSRGVLRRGLRPDGRRSAQGQRGKQADRI